MSQELSLDFNGYLGMINAQELAEYVAYNKERIEVYYKKEVLKLPPPWTEHKWISSFKFTNVFRKHDRQTVWAIDNILNNKDLSWESKALNVVLFQLINRGDSYLERFGNRVLPLYEMSREEIIKMGLEEKRRYEEGPPYSSPCQSNAYFLSTAAKMGNEYAPPEIHYTNAARAYLVKEWNDPILWAWTAPFAYEALDHLYTVPALGGFMAYQCWATMAYSAETKYTDNDAIVCGPGTTRGIWYMLDRNNPPGGFELFLEWWHQNIKDICAHYGLEWAPEVWLHFMPENERFYTRQMWTNSFCEFAKLYKLNHEETIRARWYDFRPYEK